MTYALASSPYSLDLVVNKKEIIFLHRKPSAEPAGQIPHAPRYEPSLATSLESPVRIE